MMETQIESGTAAFRDFEISNVILTQLSDTTSLAWPYCRFFPFLCGGGGKKGLVYHHYTTCTENRQILAIIN